MNFFELRDDMEIPGRWVLGDLRGKVPWVDPWQFTAGQRASTDSPLTFEILLQGKALDFSLNAYGVPVVSSRAARLLEDFCGPQVQMIEVTVPGHAGVFFIANATRLAECVDEHRSQGIRRFTEADGQPDRIGDYHAMDQLVIDPNRTGALDLFRVAHYTIALIVSERLKRRIEEAKLVGPSFHAAS